MSQSTTAYLTENAKSEIVTLPAARPSTLGTHRARRAHCRVERPPGLRPRSSTTSGRDQASHRAGRGGFYLASLSANEPPDYINHSCEPNAGLDGQITIVALHRIHAGEEVTIDYAMCDGTPYDEFDCACGALVCRGRVTGDDWRDPDIVGALRRTFLALSRAPHQGLAASVRSGASAPLAVVHGGCGQSA